MVVQRHLLEVERLLGKAAISHSAWPHITSIVYFHPIPKDLLAGDVEAPF